MLNYMITDSGITCIENGDSFMVSNESPAFEKVLALLDERDTTLQNIKDVADVKAQVVSCLSDDKKVFLSTKEDGSLNLIIDGEIISVIDPALERLLVEALKTKDSSASSKLRVTTFLNFCENLYQNPSNHSILQLMKFIEHSDLPLTKDGCFLAYKKVAPDYKDLHSGTFDNSIGKKVEMPRYEVNDDPHVTCSTGLHACSYNYLNSYGESHLSGLDRVVIVKINPKNVVSVPDDYDYEKLRVCEYEVVDELPKLFELKLQKYVSLDHKEGWMSKAWSQVEEVYKKVFGEDFWKEDFRKCSFDACANFWKEVKAKFPFITKYGDDFVSPLEEKHQIAAPLKLFSYISNFDDSNF